MKEYDELDLVSTKILGLLLGRSLNEVRIIQKKVEDQIGATFYCVFDETSIKNVVDEIKKEIG